jgi:hypothetical protein
MQKYDLSLKLLLRGSGAEYYLRVYRLFNRFPRQILLYVGDAPLLMGTALDAPSLTFPYEASDIRDFDGEQLLESNHIGDNIMAILARLRDRRRAIQRILAMIAGLEPGAREAALSQLLRISGLRRLEEIVEREARTMPVFNPIMDNKVLGREIKRGIVIGEAKMLRLQIQSRFGPIPDWADKQIANVSADEIEDLGIRLLSAKSLEALLNKP